MDDIADLVAVGKSASASRIFEPVVRARVMERLQVAARYPIALMIAPAGYGKSVALRHFIAGYQGRYVRYNVRSDNGTLLGYVRGLVEALDEVAPKAIASLASAYGGAASAQEQARNLAAWLHAHIKRYDGLVIVDDLHVAREDPAVSLFLAEIVERTREKARWFISTRDELDLPIASWLAYGYADLPVDAVDLRFQLSEARASADAASVFIRDEELAKLLDLTDGWATALTFALRTSVRSTDLSAVAAGTRDMVYRYLAEQVFRELPPEHRAFLLETCVYPSIDVPLLEKSGYDKAAAIVEELRKRVAFLFADSPSVYRYHDLFRDFLEHQLLAAGKQRMDASLDRAARALEAAGRIGEALQGFIRAAKSLDVTRVLELHGYDLIERGQADIVETALRAASADDATSRPTLLTIRALFEAQEGRSDRAEPLFERALELETDRCKRAVIADRYARAVGDSDPKRAVQLLEPFANADLPRSLQAQIVGALGAATTLLGRFEDGARYLDRALKCAGQGDDEQSSIRIRLQKAFACYVAKDLVTAASLAGECVRDATAAGFYRLACSGNGILGTIARDSEDHAKAIWYMRQMADAALKGGWRERYFFALASLLRYETEKGDEQVVRTIAARLDEFGPAAYFGVRETLLPAQALQRAWSGDFSYAYEILAGSAQGQRGDYRALRYAEIALYAAASSKRAEARDAIESAQREVAGDAGPAAMSNRCAKSLLLCAIAHTTMGQTSSARRVLAVVERNAHKYPSRLRALLGAARAMHLHQETQVAHQQVADALNDLRAQSYGGYARLFERLPVVAAESASPFASLTKTELEVLRALARGGTSRIIAEETGRSAQTIDAHVKAIARKLGCRGRREAIVLARRRGLVG